MIFVSPHVPSGLFFSREQFHSWYIAHQFYNFPPGLVRLFTVALYRGNNKLMDTGRLTLRMSFYC